jgi:hypothetical protein
MDSRKPLLIAATALTVAACAATPDHHHAAPPNSAVTSTAPTPTASASASQAVASGCVLKLTTWGDRNGVADLTRLGSALIAMGKVGGKLGASGFASSSELAKFEAANASFGQRIRVLRSHMPPSCIPGMRAALAAALTHYFTAYQKARKATQLIAAGNPAAALTQFRALTAALNAGNAEVKIVDNDIMSARGSV